MNTPRIPIILIVSVLIIGCPNESSDLENYNDTKAENAQNPPSDEKQREIKYERWSKGIDEQFWPFSLDEYQLQEKDSDIVYSLGGRWITVRYLLREGYSITRDEMVQRIIRSLKFYEWERTDLPEGKYVLSKIYEKAKDDLHFTRGSFTSNDVVLHYKTTIHISDDAKVLVLYCDAGW